MAGVCVGKETAHLMERERPKRPWEDSFQRYTPMTKFQPSLTFLGSTTDQESNFLVLFCFSDAGSDHAA